MSDEPTGEEPASVTLHAPSPISRTATLIILGASGLYAFGMAVEYPAIALRVFLLYALAAVIVLPFALVRRTIVAGSDGLEVRWFFGRFVPYSQIARAKPTDNDGVQILLQSGESFDVSGPKARALLDRIWIALEARAQMTVHTAEEALLARGSRNAWEWFSALAALAGQASTYRGGGVSRDRLWAIAENPSATPELRAAAAVALSPLLDAPAKKHLRVVADASARPELRAAMTAATDDAPPSALVLRLEGLHGENP